LNYLKNIFKDKEIKNREILITDEMIFRYNIVSEIDYVTIELWFLVKDENIEYKNIDFIKNAENF
jgi:hypothetical protein